MSPSMSARYASLYDITVGDDGKQYIAKMIDSEMKWVLNDKNGFPLISLDVMDIDDIVKGTDGNDYIVMMSKNKKYWALKKNGNKKKPSVMKNTKDQLQGLPTISIEIMDIDDVLKGSDGNEYIVKKVNGVKQYVIHQKIYSWSKSGVLYKTLDTNSECYSMTKKSNTKGNKTNC
jgi:hypothetical protein